MAECRVSNDGGFRDGPHVVVAELMSGKVSWSHAGDQHQQGLALLGTKCRRVRNRILSLSLSIYVYTCSYSYLSIYGM